jgi:hypothetical protein
MALAKVFDISRSPITRRECGCPEEAASLVAIEEVEGKRRIEIALMRMRPRIRPGFRFTPSALNGTRRAAGRPPRAMMVSSAASAGSSNWDSRVLASEMSTFSLMGLIE